MFHKARVLQWFSQNFSLSAYAIFLHYFPFTNTFFYFNSSLLHYVSPFSFYSFYNVAPTGNPLKRRDIYICTYTGEDWGSGFTFIYALRSLILFLSLTASNWDYLY